MTIKDNLLSVVAENAEALLDSVTDNDLVKGIPIIGTAVGLAKTGKGVSDFLFAKKVNVLLISLDEATEEDRNKVKEFALKDKNSEKLAENILNSLSKMTDKAKAEIIANLLLGYLNEEINESEFRRSLDIVDGLFIDDLLAYFQRSLSVSYNKRAFLRWLSPTFLNTPLFEERISTPKRPMNDGKEWDLTQKLLEEPRYKPTLLGRHVHSAYQYGLKSRGSR